MIKKHWSYILFLFVWRLSLGIAFGQTYAGIYSVSGIHPSRGPFDGQIELFWTGDKYDFTRIIEFRSFTYGDDHRLVSTIWTGSAIDTSKGVSVSLNLQRMGWALGGVHGLPQRTEDDGAPMVVQGFYTVMNSGTLKGYYVGEGETFEKFEEDWVHGEGKSPIWEVNRVVVPSYEALSLFKRLFTGVLFHSYRSFLKKKYRSLDSDTPVYTNTAAFKSGIQYQIYDQTDFDYYQRNPCSLRVVDKIIDDLALEEALVKANAFGKKLYVKAEESEADIRERFMDRTGTLVNDDHGQARFQNDGALWTGVYAYSQWLQHKTTGEMDAWDRMRKTINALLIHMTITERWSSDEKRYVDRDLHSGERDFARTLRTTTEVGSSSQRWIQGEIDTKYSGFQWRTGGNNDMITGLLWGGLTAVEGLPPLDELRLRYGKALGKLADQHKTTKGLRRKPNATLAYGIASLLLEGRSAEDYDYWRYLKRYKRYCRHPLIRLYNRFVRRAGPTFFNITDWSGTHLNISKLIMENRLAHQHNMPNIVRITMRIINQGVVEYGRQRRTLHVIAAGLCEESGEIDETLKKIVLSSLQEFPIPRPQFGEKHAFRQDFALSPYPALFWKFDWRRKDRTQSAYAYPLFEQQLGSYFWKNNPYAQVTGENPDPEDYPSVDYLFAYWFARERGFISSED